MRPCFSGGQSADAHHVRHVWRAVLRAWRTAAAHEAAGCVTQHAAQQARAARSSTPAARAAPPDAAPGAQARPEQRRLPAVALPGLHAAGADRRPVCRSRAEWEVTATAAAATCSAAHAAPRRALDRAERGLVLGQKSVGVVAVEFAASWQDLGEGAELAAAEVVVAAAETALGRTVARSTPRAPRPGRLAWQSPAWEAAALAT